MPDAAEYRRALAAVTRILVQAQIDSAEPEWTAREVLTTLAGHGWRRTVQPAPPWQPPARPGAPPTDEWREARATMRGRS